MIYTDGSQQRVPLPLDARSQVTLPKADYAASIVFSTSPPGTKWEEKDLHILTINHQSSFGSSYSEELLAATMAAHLHSLPGGPRFSTTITDCQGLCSQTHKHMNTFFHSESWEDQPLATAATLSRDGSEEGILFHGLLSYAHSNQLQHVKSHPEQSGLGTDFTRYSEHQMGNYICDQATRGSFWNIETALNCLYDKPKRYRRYDMTLRQAWSLQSARKLPYFTVLDLPVEETCFLQHDSAAVCNAKNVEAISRYIANRHLSRNEGYAEWQDRL